MAENVSLVELVDGMNAIMTQIIENNGELTPETEGMLFQVETQLASKVDSYAFIMDRLGVEVEFWKNKAAEYNAVAKSCDNLHDRLKNAIKGAMIALNQDAAHGIDFRFQLSRTKPRLCIDESKLPSAYKMQVIETRPDKDKINADLLLGVPIEGVHTEESYALRKYVNSKKGK